MSKKRKKSPSRHRVKAHSRQGKRVKSYERGSGNKGQKPRSVLVRSKKRKGYRVIPLDDSANLFKAGYGWILEEGIIDEPSEVRDLWADYGEEEYTPTGRTRDITFMLIVHNRLYPTEVTARQGYRYEPGDDEWYIDDIPG